MEMDAGTIIALLVAIGGLLTAYFNRKLIRADATEKISSAATHLVEPYVRRVESLEAAMSVLEGQLAIERKQRISLQNQLDEERKGRKKLEAALAVESEQRQELQRGVVILSKQLEAAGLTPGWYPPA